jgi:predicted RNA-binding protein Jag
MKQKLIKDTFMFPRSNQLIITKKGEIMKSLQNIFSAHANSGNLMKRLKIQMLLV